MQQPMSRQSQGPCEVFPTAHASSILLLRGSPSAWQRDRWLNLGGAFCTATVGVRHCLHSCGVHMYVLVLDERLCCCLCQPRLWSRMDVCEGFCALMALRGCCAAVLSRHLLVCTVVKPCVACIAD